MATISIEVKCDSQAQAEGLTNRVLNGNHHIGRKHGSWFWFCECPLDEVLNIGQELHYELNS
jgi:hypothetical protein